jgi:hypothetical protein
MTTGPQTRTKRRIPLTRRAALLLMVGLGMGGCTYSLDFGNADFVPSCGYGVAAGLGNPDFSYVCPATAPAPTLTDAGAPNIELTFSSDPQCALFDSLRAFGLSSFGMPTVAVGEAFRIEYDGDAGPDASTPPLPAEPAVDSVAHQTAEGWVIQQPGYLGFVARQGADVLAFTHVLAREAESIGFASRDLDGGPPAGAPLDASPGAFSAVVGVPARILAYPRADDGTLLAGSLSCVFASGEPSRLTVTSEGVVAKLSPLAPGSVTLTATCLGMQGTAVIQITGAAPALDGGSADGGDDDDTSDADDVDATTDANDASDAQDVNDAKESP